MKNHARDIVIGLTAIGGLLVLVWMLTRFGELAAVGAEYKRVVLRVDSARGVSPAAPVTYRGVRIGDVTGVALAPDGSGMALVSVRYRDTTDIPSEFDVFLDASFVGDATLDIEPREGWTMGAAPGAGEEYTVAVRSLTSSLQDELVERLERLDQTAAKIETLAETYTDVGERLAGVIDSDNPGESDLRATLDRVEAVLAQAEGWLDDGALLADVRDAIVKFEDAATVIGDETRALRVRADSTLTNADTALVSLDQAGQELTAITARINRGEGTLGQLATNPDLYNSLNAAVEQLRALLTDAKLLIEKYRDEGVPINL